MLTLVDIPPYRHPAIPLPFTVAADDRRHYIQRVDTLRDGEKNKNIIKTRQPLSPTNVQKMIHQSARRRRRKIGRLLVHSASSPHRFQVNLPLVVLFIKYICIRLNCGASYLSGRGRRPRWLRSVATPRCIERYAGRLACRVAASMTSRRHANWKPFYSILFDFFLTCTRRWAAAWSRYSSCASFAMNGVERGRKAGRKEGIVIFIYSVVVVVGSLLCPVSELIGRHSNFDQVIRT